MPPKRRTTTHGVRSDAGDAATAATDTNDSKRRKPSSPSTQDLGAGAGPENDYVLTEDDVNGIITNLSLPDPNTFVAQHHSNSISNTEVQAYAKLAGPSWTFYVQKLKIVIGRSSEPVFGPNGEQLAPSSEERIDIDLGPAKVVSRRHAHIEYNLESRTWDLTVTGRNGVRIDKVAHREGSVQLTSGNVLDIGGVQMMFVLPDIPPRIAPGMLNPQSSKHRKTASVSSIASAPSPAAGIAGPGPSITSGLNGSTGPTGTIDSSGSNGNPAPGNVSMPYSHQRGYLSQHQNAQNVQQHQNQQQPLQASNQPMKQQQQQQQQSSNLYPKGVAIISRPQIRGIGAAGQYMDQDLSTDEAKDIKPPFSYATMITQAIMSTDEMMMSLADIYDWIASNYSFYRHSKSGWQNSIRHNLSLNKAFEKVPRPADKPGKGMKWQITPQYKEEFIRKANLGKLAKGSSRKSGQYGQVVQLTSVPPPPLAQQHPQHILPPQHQPPPASQQQLPSLSSSLPPADDMTVASAAADRQRKDSATGLPPLNPSASAPVPGAALNGANTNGSSSGPASGPNSSSRSNSGANSGSGSGVSSANTSKGSSSALGITFETPQRPSLPRTGYLDAFEFQGGHYGDQYGFGGGAGGGGVAGTFSPSPSKRYPVSQLEAYTPDRGSTFTNSTTQSASKQNQQQNKLPTPSFGSIISGNTPAPQASHLQLAAPSSAQQQQLPSSFMPASSPAPFWKYMQLSSTPVRLGTDFSPTKFSSPVVETASGNANDDAIGDEKEETQGASGGGAAGNTEKRRGEPSMLGDLQDVDLTRGFRHIGKSGGTGSNASSNEATPEVVTLEKANVNA